MGMSHTPTPAEGYVSVISYDPTLGAHQLHQASQPLIHHQQMNTFATAQSASVLHDQNQTLLLVSQTNGGFIAQTDQLPKSSSLLVVTDLALCSSPQSIVLPTGNVIQVPMHAGLHVPSAESLTLIADAPQHTLNLASPSAVNFVQMPNTLLLNQNVILCVQPDDAMSYQLTADSTQMNCLSEVSIDLMDESSSMSVESVTAKAWYNDSDLANRALTALSRQPQTSVTHADHLGCSSSVTTASYTT